jgi:hypothetical protein
VESEENQVIKTKDIHAKKTAKLRIQETEILFWNINVYTIIKSMVFCEKEESKERNRRAQD